MTAQPESKGGGVLGGTGVISRRCWSTGVVRVLIQREPESWLEGKMKTGVPPASSSKRGDSRNLATKKSTESTKMWHQLFFFWMKTPANPIICLILPWVVTFGMLSQSCYLRTWTLLSTIMCSSQAMFHLSHLYKTLQNGSPLQVGIEPTTSRLTVSRSTYWANKEGNECHHFRG